MLMFNLVFNGRRCIASDGSTVEMNSYLMRNMVSIALKVDFNNDIHIKGVYGFTMCMQ